MIKIENLHYSTSSKPVLSNLSIDIQDGEILGITGPGGCGKTTLLKLIYGEIKPQKGTVILNNEAGNHNTGKKIRKNASYLPNRFDFNPESTVFDEILNGRIHLKKILNPYNDYDREATTALIEELHIEAFSGERLKNLPYSIQKISTIAKTFNTEAETLLIDNPESGLDLLQKFQLLRLFKKYVKRGEKTIILASADLDFLLKSCDRLVFIKDGNISDSGGPEMINEKIIKDIFGINALVGRNLVTGLPEIHVIDIN